LVIEQNLAENGFTERSGEFGALTDVSDKLGQPDTFMLNLQPLLKRNDFVKGATFPHNEGGQIILLKGCRDKFIIKTNIEASIFLWRLFSL
jgi:hypothetical protein